MSDAGFDASLIQAEYDRLGYLYGWTFMATPESSLRKARIAFVGLNPGGGGPKDSYAYGGSWDSPLGNAYYLERWGKDNRETAIQQQIWNWHSLLDLEPEDSFCAHFVPFRSPDWKSLPHKDDALQFAGRLWQWTLGESPASLFVTMGKLPAELLARILSARRVAALPSGWGNQTIDVWDSPDGRRLIGMPHPSRYRLFGRAGDASAVAEHSFRTAAGIAS